MKNILFVSTQPQRFLSQLKFARKINKLTKEIKIYFFITENVNFKFRNQIDGLEFKIINKVNKKYNLSKKFKFKNFFYEIIKKFFSKKKKIKFFLDKIKYTKLFTYIFIKQEQVFLDNLNKEYKKIFKLIKRNNINTILLNGDRHLGYEPIFLKISKDLYIPSIIIYLGHYATEENITYKIPHTKKIKQNILTSSYVTKSQNNLKYKIINDRYFYRHPIANALSNFGVLSPNPYVMGSGYSDILCLPNNYYKDLYKKLKVNEGKIRVVGEFIYDHLYERFLRKNDLKKEIIIKYKLNKTKKIIFIGLPQYAEHHILTWNKHWEEINFLVKNVCELNETVLISLHPKMDRDKYQFLENEYNCKILNEPLEDILPIADLYVAGFSSTIIWSVLCGIKTILLDSANLKYKMYDYLKSVKKVNQKKDFKKTIMNTISSDINFDEDWMSLSKPQIFDGKVVQRYIDLIKEVN